MGSLDIIAAIGIGIMAGVVSAGLFIVCAWALMAIAGACRR